MNKIMHSYQLAILAIVSWACVRRSFARYARPALQLFRLQVGIRLFWEGLRPGTYTNYVVYSFGYDSAILRAALTPPNRNNPSGAPARPFEVSMTYRFYGDGVLLHASPPIGVAAPSFPIEINIIGVQQLRIEMEISIAQGWGHTYRFNNDWRGLENAVVTVTEYRYIE